MKKKDYLQKMEQGALIGTLFLLLNGMISCSKEPMDTPPAETFMTKSPVGPPGIGGMTYYPPCDNPNLSPILLKENEKSGFIMTNGYCMFRTTIPAGYDQMEITMNENETSYTRFIDRIEVSSEISNFHWEKWTTLRLRGFKFQRYPGEGYPPRGTYIKIYSTVTRPVVLHFKFIE